MVHREVAHAQNGRRRPRMFICDWWRCIAQRLLQLGGWDWCAAGRHRSRRASNTWLQLAIDERATTAAQDPKRNTADGVRLVPERTQRW